MASSADSSGRTLFKKALRFRPKKDRTYIVPTKFGTAFAATVLILFFFAVGYANNLIYIFVFFLIAVALMGTWATNKNVDGLLLEKGLEPILYAQTDNGLLELVVRTKNKEGSLQIQAGIKKKPLQETFTNVEPNELKKISIAVRYPSRGYHKPAAVNLQSDFPFGLLRSWKTVHPWEKILVYPKLEGQTTLPREASGEDNLGGLGVFREHRPYASSDPMNRIDWKASARRSEILTKHYEEQAQKSYYFEWRQTQHLKDFEKRVSQLALWADRAYKENHTFIVKLGSRTFDMPDANLNWRQCMHALAVLTEKDVAG